MKNSLHNVTLPEGWEVTDLPLHEELHRELGESHPLHQVPARAIARRKDNDDVLFFLSEGTSPLVVVHLTWSGKKETDPRFPAFTLYSSIEDWLRGWDAVE